MKPSEKHAAAGRFEYAGLDRLLHERARLGMVASLAAHPRGLLFNDLKRLCGLTDGNLSRHLSVLQEAGVVEIAKGFARNRPQTSCRLTAAGRGRFAAYLAELEQVVADAATALATRGGDAAAALAVRALRRQRPLPLPEGSA